MNWCDVYALCARACLCVRVHARVLVYVYASSGMVVVCYVTMVLKIVYAFLLYMCMPVCRCARVCARVCICVCARACAHARAVHSVLKEIFYRKDGHLFAGQQQKMLV